jgi:hypothetical protein
MLAVAPTLTAQKFKEGLKAMKEQYGKSDEAEVAVSTEAMDQQGEIQKFLSGAKVYTIQQGASGSFSHYKFNGESAPIEDKVYKIEKNGEKVTGFTAYPGIMTPENNAVPMYWQNKNMNEHILFINGNMYHVQNLKPDGSFYKLVSINTLSKEQVKACTKWDKDHVVNVIAEYWKAIKPLNEKATAEKQAAGEAKEAENRAKYTIKGKQVTGLKVLCGDNGTMQQGKVYSVTVIATLKDGSTISTAEGGYMDEFEISATGVPVTYKDPTNFMNERSCIGSSTVSIPDAATISGDKVVVTVKSKFDSKMTASVSNVMYYGDKVMLDYNPNQYQNAGDMRIEIKQVSHAIDKNDLIECKVYGSKGDVLRHFRINKEAMIVAQTNGNNGSSGENGKNGGNITIVVDPSVSSYNIQTSNRGGKPGKGGILSGADGKVETLKQKVTW